MANKPFDNWLFDWRGWSLLLGPLRVFVGRALDEVRAYEAKRWGLEHK